MGASAEKTAKSDKPAKNQVKKTGFFKGLKSEFKKISWPDKEATFKQSVAVFAITVVLGVVIAILDYIIQYGVNILTSF